MVACADYGELLEGLHWSHWTSSSASAVGTLVYNDCVPYCAAGHFHRVSDTKITLNVPVEGAHGVLVWSEVRENPQPPGYETGSNHNSSQGLPTQPD